MADQEPDGVADRTQAAVGRFVGRDGTELSYREIGTGPAVVLFHGFLADSRQWLEHGHAATLAAAGYRIVLPDLRGHGPGDRSHDPRDYPADVLTQDGLALVEQLGLVDYTLGGYSLGARVAARMLVGSARPCRAILAGQGLGAVTSSGSAGTLRRALRALADGRVAEPGSAEGDAAHWIVELGADPHAMLLVLDSLVPTSITDLRAIRTPTLVVAGDRDAGQSDAGSLANVLAGSRFATVPGNHWTALGDPVMTALIAEFLADPAL